MNGLLIGVGMGWRGDGHQGMHWFMFKRSLNQDLSLLLPFSSPNLSPKSRGSIILLSLDKKSNI
jgi:hypothetical protein